MDKGTIIIAAVVMFAAPATAQNFLVNPGFDAADQLDGWTCSTFDGVATWNAEDRNGSPDSGSMQHDVDGAANNAKVRCEQCVPVTELKSYIISAWHYWPDDPDVAQIGTTRLSISYYSDAGCSSILEVGPTKTGNHVALDTWYYLESDEWTAPQGAQSAMVYVFTWQNFSGQPVRSRLDDLSFAFAAFFLDGFESGDLSGWSSSVP